MLTIVPVTRIGGVLSSTWPFHRLPASIYAWRQLSLNVSLRAERDSPYAAVQTLCWEPLCKEHDTALTPARQEPGSLPLKADVSSSAQFTFRSSPAHWAVLAGNVCLIGGAAICAWIVFGHSPLRPPQPRTDFADAASSALPRAMYQAAQLPSPPQPALDSIIAPPVIPAQPKIASMESALPPSRTEARALAFGTKLVPLQAMTKTKVGAVEHGRVGNSRLTLLHKHRQTGPKTLRFVGPAHSHRLHTHNLAGPEHVPAVPVMTGAESHVSVTLPRSDSFGTVALQKTIDAADKNPTEWMSHISQRRITEVSGEFSK